jgi:hypothetical protein
MLNGKETEAKSLLLKTAKINKKTLPDEDLEKPVILGQRVSFRQLFSSWKLAATTLISWDLW